MDRVEAAHTLKDLAVLPGNRFEAVKGRAGPRSDQPPMADTVFRVDDVAGQRTCCWTTTRRDKWHASPFIPANIWRNLTP